LYVKKKLTCANRHINIDGLFSCIGCNYLVTDITKIETTSVQVASNFVKNISTTHNADMDAVNQERDVMYLNLDMY
jgi:hypothetical protein